MSFNLIIEKFNYSINYNQRSKLFKESFPSVIGSSTETYEHYKWKFHSLNKTPASYEYIAKLGTELVGYYSAVPISYSVNNKIIETALVCDVMTSPKVRRQGLFTELGNYSLNELTKNYLNFTLGYPTDKHVMFAHEKAGWKNHFNLPFYIKFIKFDSFLKKIKLNYFSLFLNIPYFVLNKIYESFIFRSIFKVDRLTANDFISHKGLVSFMDQFNKSHFITLDKSKNFLEWRLNMPNKKYNIHLVHNEVDNIIGCAITLETIRSNIPVLEIIDIIAVEYIDKTIKSLIFDIRKYSYNLNVDAIVLMINPSVFKKYSLKKLGFIKSPYKFLFILRNLTNKISNNILGNEKNWHITFINYDDQ